MLASLIHLMSQVPPSNVCPHRNDLVGNTLPWKANGEKGWLDVLAAVLGTLSGSFEYVLDAPCCISPK